MQRTEPRVADGATSSISYRLLQDWSELHAAVEVIRVVWGDSAIPLASPSLLRAYVHAGNPVLGAVDGTEVRGVSIGFLAPGGGIHLHSHITGVLPSHQHLGLGFGLKQAQRAWCVDHGIDLVMWTFDPLLARNAYFNFHKLGATSRRLLPAFYGTMTDEVNAGDTTDRLEVRWDIGPDRAAATRNGAVRQRVAVPRDYLELRRRDPAAAAEVRSEVRSELIAALASGLEIVDFDPDGGYCLAAGESS